jgi:trimethylamine--corrinoid protein Co-methyltransferase
MLAALAGANLIYGLGMIESGMTFDYGQLVLDNEIAKMIKYVVGGISVNDETLSVDVTKEVGHFSDFLSHENTYSYMRSQSQTMLMDRRVRSEWETMGSTTVHQRANEEARRIMETHQPDPLPNDVLAKLRAIVESAEEELKFK